MSDVRKSSGDDRSNTTSHHTVQSEREQGTITFPGRPIQWVIIRVVRLRIENDLTIFSRLFLLFWIC